MTRGREGSRSSLGNTASRAPSTEDMVKGGEASTPLVTTGILPVPAGGRGEVVTSRKGDVVSSRMVEVCRTGVVRLRVAATVLGVAVIVRLRVIMVAAVWVAVTMVTGFGVAGLVVGGAEVGSLNWGGKGDGGRWDIKQ